VAESFALTATMIKRSVGDELSDEQIAVAFALLDEAEGHRVRRARRTVALLARRLSERERALAAALLVFWFDVHDLRVHVITADHIRAEAEVDLYREINERTGTGRPVELLMPGQRAADRSDPGITVGAFEAFAASGVPGHIAVLRVPATARGYSMVAGLPHG
jgi:hypothetical protein